MRINHNISALKANNQLAKTNSKLDKSLEKLSSGYRINSAADDSAGLAISEKMRTQISGLDQASRNASDGISVIQTAEGALNEVTSMLQRMRELAVESANGTYTTQDRVAIQSEIDQLKQEITRISDTTEFNTMTLLNGNIDRKSYSSDNRVGIISMSDTVSVGDYSVKITKDARQAVIVGNATSFTGLASDRKITAAEAGSININGESVKVSEGETVEAVFEKIRNACDDVDINVFANKTSDTPSTTNNLDNAGYTSKVFSNGDRLVFVSQEYGSDQKINLYCDNTSLCNLFGLTIRGASSSGFDAEAQLMLKDESPKSQFQNTATVSVNGNKITVSDRNDFSMVLEAQPGTVKTKFQDAAITSSSAVITPGYTVTQDARQAVIVGDVTSFTDPASSVTVPSGESIVFKVNGSTITVNSDPAGESLTSFLSKIKTALGPNAGIDPIAADAVPTTDVAKAATAGYDVETVANFKSGDRLLLYSKNSGSTNSVEITSCSSNITGLLGLKTAAEVKGIDAQVELAAGTPSDISAVVNGSSVDFKDTTGVIHSDSLAFGAAGTIFTDATITSSGLQAGKIESSSQDMDLTVLDAGPMDLQIGANDGQTMSIRIPKVTPETLGIDKVNIATADGAQEAIGLLDTAINTVSAIRSKLGAYQNRLEHSISNLDVTQENMTESLSRIQDVDMAEEMAEYTQKNVLAQAGTSMLAQANQRPQQILSLLQQG